MAQSNIDKLAQELGRADYQELFLLPNSQLRIDALWNRPEAPELLLQLAIDGARPWRTRFLASELIFHKQMFLHRPGHFPSLAPVYAKALEENASGFMSDWGFLRDMNDPGKLGSRFILFGRAANQALRPLLDDPRQVPYMYPPEFPSQIRVGFRIQDFAALYLSNINHH